MYHSFLLRSGITIIVLDNSKYCLMSICFILELRLQVKLFMKLCSQEMFKAWFVTTSLDLGPCWIVWSFERCWERCLSNRFIPCKTNSLSVKVLLQKMTASFRECIPILLPTALTINTSYLHLDKVLLKNAMIYSCWRGVVDRFIMSNMKLTPTNLKKYPTSLEKPTISAMLPPKLQPTIYSRLFCGFMGSDTHKYHTQNTSLPSASSWYLLKCCFRELLYPYPV